uniref:Uncharacterized protein n=1 Tax=Myoviridae sp. ctgXL3 TaxID=2826681 RepID=A0A8S5QS37_9CAUD|nr:MAG TPA: hypothetical protein [Myoviridae sp. ctgXL3]
MKCGVDTLNLVCYSNTTTTKTHHEKEKRK